MVRNQKQNKQDNACGEDNKTKDIKENMRYFFWRFCTHYVTHQPLVVSLRNYTPIIRQNSFKYRSRYSDCLNILPIPKKRRAHQTKYIISFNEARAMPFLLRKRKVSGHFFGFLWRFNNLQMQFFETFFGNGRRCIHHQIFALLVKRE